MFSPLIGAQVIRMARFALVVILVLDAIQCTPTSRRSFHLDGLIDVNANAEEPILRKRQDMGQMNTGSTMQDGSSGSGYPSYGSSVGGDSSSNDDDGFASSASNGDEGDPYIQQDPSTLQPASNQSSDEENVPSFEQDPSGQNVDEIQQTTTTTTTTIEEEELANQQQNPSELNVNFGNVTIDDSHDNTSLLNNTNSGVQNNGGNNGGSFSATNQDSPAETQPSSP